MTDVDRTPIFASVAADLRLVPGGHHSLAECQPYATPQPRDESGRFAKKEHSA